jgi:UPF0755 protein
MKKSIDAIIIILVPLLIFALYVFWMPNWHDDPKGKIVTIPSGASFRTAVDSLVNAGVVRNKWAFQLAGRFLGYTKSIKKGRYLFPSGRSNLEILKDINIGRSWLIIHVTIPEGWRIERIAQRFGRDLGADSVKIVSLCHNENFIRSHGIGAPSLEGFLMPDTYSFYWQTDETEILGRMLDGFKQFYTDSLKIRQEYLELTQIQILTLASIVEAESCIDFERPIIAGVYWNRLKKRMRLEADPTVQYALGEEKRLRYKDLNVKSPYNTYRNRGLPPGPINNPGRSSILAALFPEQHGFLYFVATGMGGHYFAKTYAEHQKNIRHYKRMRRELKRLSSK